MIIIEHDIPCFERTLVIKCQDSYEDSRKHIEHLLWKYYFEWHMPEDVEDADDREWLEADACCEEYMMNKLSRTYPELKEGTWNSVYYGEDENEKEDEFQSKREEWHTNVETVEVIRQQLLSAMQHLEVFELIGNQAYHVVEECIQKLKKLDDIQYVACTRYKCKACGQEFIFPDDERDCGGYSHPDGEELLWGHIQMEHEDIFEEVRDLETPFMIEECYEEEC